ncbi:MAG: T9SS type A sorting domain-containing protein [Melioribacteraceae bacterium]|nr:T9SS type A sorting domain-containing protein [Melioribacteraceae bacterium]
MKRMCIISLFIFFFLHCSDVLASIGEGTSSSGSLSSIFLISSPNGGESLRAGSTNNITWADNNSGRTIKLEYSTNNGTNWTTVVASTAASTESYLWRVPNTPSTDCKVKISDASDGSVTDQSDAVFTIYQQTVVVTSPNGGENWIVGSTQAITWTSTNVTNVKIEYSTNNGSSWSTVIATTPASAGNYNWTIPNSPSNQCIVKISDVSDASITDQSDANFTVGLAPSTTVSIPNITANMGEEVLVPINAEVNDLGSVNINIGYDSTVLTFVEVANNNLIGGSFVVNPQDNAISIAWFNTTPVDIASKILDLKFVYNGGASFVGFLGTNQISDGFSNQINAVFIDGSISETIVRSSMLLGNISAIAGTEVSVPLSGLKLNNIGSFNLDVMYDAAVLEFVRFENVVSGSLVGNEVGGRLSLGYFTANGLDLLDGDIADLVFNYSGGNSVIAFDADSADIQDTDFNAVEIDLINGSVYENTQPTIVIASPNGTENWLIGTSQNITWISSNVRNVKIEYTTNNGTSWTTIIASTPAAANSYSWTVPNTQSTNCKVKISDATNVSITDQSDAVFSIYQPSIVVTSPNGGENWEVGSNHNINWTSSNVANVKIEYSTNNGSSWSTVISSTLSDGNYNWTIPNTPSTNSKIRISEVGGNVFDISNTVFTINAVPNPTIEVTSPNGGEEWLVGSNQTIEWTSSNVDSIKIEYTLDNGIIWRKVIPGTSSIVATSNGSYTWEVRDTPSEECKVKITSTSNTNIRDESDSTFRIVRDVVVQRLEVTSPNGGEEWLVGSNQTIEWTSSNVDSIKIEYTSDNGIIWRKIINSIPSSNGSYTWDVRDNPSEECKVRITSTSNSNIRDESDSTFKIVQNVIAQTLEVTSPNGGEEWSVNSIHNITWLSNEVGSVKIEYSTDNGGSWIEIIASITASTESYTWTIPNTLSDNCIVRISDTDGNPSDVSNETFKIVQEVVVQTVVVTSPNGGETWISGTSQNITWVSEYVDNVKMEYSINSGTDWITIENSISVSSSPYTWIVPEIESENCLVRISDASNNLIYDLSDSEFTIVLTPFVTITYPNGNEIFDVGDEVNITWDSRNIEHITLESSINEGIDWITIVSDVVANSESYSWNIPNTPSVDCIVKVISVEDTSIIDQSDDTFVIYPLTVVVEREVSFGNVDADESFRMIGLPGNGNYSLSDVMKGEYGTTWKAYFDNGKEGTPSDYLEEYDGTSKFNFKPGLGFWIVAEENLKVNETFESVPVNNGYTTIALNNGWNIISNPFEIGVKWDDVKLLNSLNNASDVIYQYNGAYSISTNFEPYVGYYYLNDDGVTSINIPYHTKDSGGLAKRVGVTNNDIELELKDDKQTRSFVKLGFREDAVSGFDKYDIYFPRYIGSEGMVIINSLLEHFLIEDYRTEIGEGIEYDLRINLKQNKKYKLNVSGLENYQDYEIVLIDTRLSKVYYFDEETVPIKSIHKENSFRLLFGNSQFIKNEIKNLIPREYLLYQNYPNPFNPSTVIRFSLPKESKVELKIYSVIGEVVKTLISNQAMNAGNHEIEFIASSLASGVYFYRIIADDFTDVKKLVLLK